MTENIMKISTQQYSKTLLDLTDEKSEAGVLVVVQKFAEKLRADGQLKNSAKIMKKFAELYNTKYGIISAEVTSREELSKDALAEITEYLKKKYAGNAVEIKNIVDADIKGGIIVRVGDEVLDGSVGTQLKKLQNILSK